MICVPTRRIPCARLRMPSRRGWFLRCWAGPISRGARSALLMWTGCFLNHD
nr:MAG TPA: hypothetical protein [Caudoviricetes sp.]